MNSGYTLHICGSRGSHTVHGAEFLEFGGYTSCYVLKKGTHAIVLDCGTGLLEAEPLLADCQQIDVVLSHLHYDHIIGLTHRTFPPNLLVHIYAEFDQWGGIDVFKNFISPPFWPVDAGNVCCVNVTQEIELTAGVRLNLYPANHPNYASIIRLDFEDTSFCAAIDHEHGQPFPADAIAGCQWLLYDGMFTQEEYPRYKGWGHSTWQAGCAIAKQYQVPFLLIGHHSAIRNDQELRLMEQQAKLEFPWAHFTRWREAYQL